MSAHDNVKLRRRLEETQAQLTDKEEENRWLHDALVAAEGRVQSLTQQLATAEAKNTYRPPVPPLATPQTASPDTDAVLLASVASMSAHDKDAAIVKLRRRLEETQAQLTDKEEEVLAATKRGDLVRRNMASYRDEMQRKVNALREALLESQSLRGEEGDGPSVQLRVLLQGVRDAETEADKERNKALSLEASRDVLLARVQRLEAAARQDAQRLAVLDPVGLKSGPAKCGVDAVTDAAVLRHKLKATHSAMVVRAQRTQQQSLMGHCFSLWLQDVEASKMNRILRLSVGGGATRPAVSLDVDDILNDVLRHGVQ